VFVAGCAGGPMTIRDSLASAHQAAAAATAELDPRQLQSDSDSESGDGQTAGQPPSDDLRLQLEQLLHALINR
jgi:heterodisulfide reductase subunit A-like polyferredoxin